MPQARKASDTRLFHDTTIVHEITDRISNVRDAAPRRAKTQHPVPLLRRPELRDRPLPGKPDPWSPSDPKFGGFWQGGKHWSEVLGDDGIDFLGQAAKSDKPFLMYLAFSAPHDPRQSPQEYVDRYPLDRIKMPENFLPLYPQREEMGAGRKLRDEKLAPFPRDEHAVKVNRQEFYAIITHMMTSSIWNPSFLS
jgi:hypothetical protein